MELLEIIGLFEIDQGSPSPMIISNDSTLFIMFYTDKESVTKIPQERNTIYDTGIVALKFSSYIKYSFGMPGNETLRGHPYNKLGMKSNAFYELKNSDLIKQLENIDKVHPYYNKEKWKTYKHYILTFHDNMFECIAKEFEINEENMSIYQQANTVLNELSVKQF